MKDLVNKLIKLLLSLKGKKPIVIGIVAVIFILGYFAVQKGLISQDLLDINLITKQVESLFSSDSVKVITDSISHVAPIVDSIAK